jgi:hypothetical protein
MRIVLVGFFLILSMQGQTGWYNGDCHSIDIGGWSNWYTSSQSYTRVYDEFAAPAGGWSVTGVFSNNQLYSAPPITQASWEIRSGVGPGNAGTVVASGLSAASQIYVPGLAAYRIQVDGVAVQLAAGQYWLSVTPVGPVYKQSYVCETQGQNAVGTPAGNGTAYYGSQSGTLYPVPASSGRKPNFSQGVLIDGPSSGLPIDPPLPPPSRDQQWQGDLLFLALQMPVLHSLPYTGISLADFNKRTVDLMTRAPNLSDAEMVTGMQSLVAAIQDAHTDITWPYPSPFQLLPLSFYWFDDGIYVTGASAQYQNLLGGKLLSVGQTGIDDATRILTSLVAHENDQWPKHRIPLKELPNASFLFGTGLIPSVDKATFQMQTASNGVISTDVASLRDVEMPRILPVFQGVAPLSRQHLDMNYWATVIDGGATIYFQYNSCMEDPKQASVDFFKQLDVLMAQSGVQRIVLDMRNNGGGFTSILSPWIDEIQTGRFNQPGRLYVIVGRATFSAAMEATNHLKDRTAAIFVGEATGAKPRFQLRRGDFALPYMGIRVSYSNGVESANDPGPTMIPDIAAGLTFQQYMDGVDPALDAILKIPAPGK